MSGYTKVFQVTVCAILLGIVAYILNSTSLAAERYDALIIENDDGGNVEEYAQRIRAIPRSTLVAIAGVCSSACTMYLGHNRTCAYPDTVFSFHGPSDEVPGRALPQDEFNEISRLMAAHYPEPIRSWFMNTARYTLVGFHDRRGSEFIRLGLVEDCSRYTFS